MILLALTILLLAGCGAGGERLTPPELTGEPGPRSSAAPAADIPEEPYSYYICQTPWFTLRDAYAAALEPYGGEYESFVYGEGPVLLIEPKLAISDFCIYTTELNEGPGDIYKLAGRIYSRPSLATGTPLAAKLPFYGSMTAYGIRFEDEYGEQITLFLSSGGLGPDEACPYVITMSSEEPAASPPPELTQGRPMPDGMSFPDPGFEPESYWLCDNFAYRGQALLLAGGAGRFKCWYNYYELTPDPPLGYDYILVCASLDDGEGSIEAEGGSLTLDCDPETASAPRLFRSAGAGEALEFWRDMPFNDEAKLPVPPDATPEELASTPGAERLSGDKWLLDGVEIQFGETESAKTHIRSYNVREPGPDLGLRGAQVGESIYSVRNRFAAAEGNWPLYGDIKGPNGDFGYSDQGHPVLMYRDNSFTARVFADFDGTVTGLEMLPHWDERFTSY